MNYSFKCRLAYQTFQIREMFLVLLTVVVRHCKALLVTDRIVCLLLVCFFFLGVGADVVCFFWMAAI